MKTIKKQAKAAVLAYLKDNPRSGYADLERVFDECGISWQGDMVICSEVNRNVVFWSGWNAAAIRLLNELMGSGQVVKDVASPVERLTAGKALDLPLVTAFVPYETEHWLPLVFSLGSEEPYKT